MIFLIQLGRHREAENFMREAVAKVGELLGVGHQRVATIMLTGATMLINNGKCAEVELMDDGGVPLGSHPAIWAPFVFVGS